MNYLPLRSISVRALLVLAALGVLAPAQAQDTMVRLHTTQGPIDVTLLGGEAPLTVANFLAYVRGGDYANVMFHRSAWVQLPSPAPFVIQAGGYQWPESGCCPPVTSRGTVANEYSEARSNVRGTVAMAKVANDPNSATSQWFINMNDNSANLDVQNGGFTVFGRVTAPGMVVADNIAALPRVNTSLSSELPVTQWQSGTPIQRSHVVLIEEATEFPVTQSSSERIFNYLEAAYPQFLFPSRAVGGEALGYVYRYYGGSNAYIGTRDGKVWYFVPAIGTAINELGSVADWLAAAQAAGY